MEGIYLRIFTTENQKHNGILFYEWLLEKAKSLGLHGGSAFRAVAGFGRHGRLREQSFLELAPDLPVEVVFLLSPEEVDKLIAVIDEERLALLYVKSVVEWGFTAGRMAGN